LRKRVFCVVMPLLCAALTLIQFAQTLRYVGFSCEGIGDPGACGKNLVAAESIEEFHMIRGRQEPLRLMLPNDIHELRTEFTHVAGGRRAAVHAQCRLSTLTHLARDRSVLIR